MLYYIYTTQNNNNNLVKLNNINKVYVKLWYTGQKVLTRTCSNYNSNEEYNNKYIFDKQQKINMIRLPNRQAHKSEDIYVLEPGSWISKVRNKILSLFYIENPLKCHPGTRVRDRKYGGEADVEDRGRRTQDLWREWGDFPNHEEVEYAGDAGTPEVESPGDVRGGVLEVK